MHNNDYDNDNNDNDDNDNRRAPTIRCASGLSAGAAPPSPTRRCGEKRSYYQ